MSPPLALCAVCWRIFTESHFALDARCSLLCCVSRTIDVRHGMNHGEQLDVMMNITRKRERARDLIINANLFAARARARRIMSGSLSVRR